MKSYGRESNVSCASGWGQSQQAPRSSSPGGAALAVGYPTVSKFSFPVAQIPNRFRWLFSLTRTSVAPSALLQLFLDV